MSINMLISKYNSFYTDRTVHLDKLSSTTGMFSFVWFAILALIQFSVFLALLFTYKNKRQTYHGGWAQA